MCKYSSFVLNINLLFKYYYCDFLFEIKSDKKSKYKNVELFILLATNRDQSNLEIDFHVVKNNTNSSRFYHAMLQTLKSHNHWHRCL